VLVVDDDEAILISLERGLLLAGFEVDTASGGAEALEVVRVAPPDAMVLDVTMPDVDGVTVLRRLRADGDDVPVCVLSARGEVAERVAGLQAGADDYLVKPFDLDELVARLHALLRRRAPLPAVRIRVGDLDIDPGRRRAQRGARPLDLTRREFDLLHAFAAHSGQVLTRGQLLELVWGYDFPVQDNAVDVFVGYLRRKLEDDGELRVIQTIRGVGFVLRPA
jgi:two-component system response regulator PrrA